MKGIPLTKESLDPQGLYLYDDGFRFIIWFGRMLSPDMIKHLLGEHFAADYSKVSFLDHHIFSTTILNRLHLVLSGPKSGPSEIECALLLPTTLVLILVWFNW